MYNSKQITEKKVGANTMNSLLNRAQSQTASSVETRLFTPHIVSGNERTRANHQNYSR
jgi:hypothetical protein